jgi:alpha-D-xyloside xylohydrolase
MGKLAVRTILIAFVLVGGIVHAQETSSARYSASPEYRQMVEELHQPSPSPMFIATGKRAVADPALRVEVQDTAAALELGTAAFQFQLDKVTARLTVHNRRSGASWTFTGLSCDGDRPNLSRKGNSWTMVSTHCPGASATITLLTTSLARLDLSGANDSNATDLHAQTIPSTPQLTFRVEGGGPYFGLGERFFQAGLKATQLDVRPQDRSGEPGHNWVYMGIPFLYTPGGLGFYVDTAFDTHFSVDEADNAVEVKAARRSVPMYLFAEPDPKAVLTAYTGLTGRPQNLPLWAYGPWITSLQGKGPVLDYAHRLRVEGVPASALWIFDELDEKNNLGWPFWFGSYYGDPRTFNDTLHGLGFHVMTYVHPYVRQKILPYPLPSPLYEQGVANKYLELDAQGQPSGPRFEEVHTGNIDFTNPAAVDWWQGMITRAVHDQGFDGWMEDFGEWVRDSDRFQNGNGSIMSELYPLLYHKVTTRAAQAANPDVVPFSRSGAPGTQTWSPVLWGADQQENWSRDYGLPSVVTAGITAGESGFSNWGPDIMSAGGARDLWMRWVEFGALTPIMRDHVWQKPDRTFNLWTDADTVAHFRRYAVLHSALLPYLATYGEEAHRTGVPIMRQPGLEYPGDPRSVAAEYEYLLGRELLIAPVVTPSNTRTLYMPPGEWVDYWTGHSLTGGQDNTVEAGTDSIPIFVKAGSILPFKPEEETARWDWYDPHLLETSLVWKAYLSETGTAHGEFRLPNGTGATLDQHGETLTLIGKSETTRDYQIILRSRRMPSAVKLNGVDFPPYSTTADGKRLGQWWWNPSSGEVHLLFHAAAFRVDLEGVVASQYPNH